jgi:murein L,D-transpeptidase YafK
MNRRLRIGLLLFLATAAGTTSAAWWLGPRSLLSAVGIAAATGARAQAAANRVTPTLRRDFAAAGVAWGAPVFVRTFKLERTLELWVARDGRFQLFRSYPICSYSGELGPKLQQGDRQAPEGYYRVRRAQMNPASQFHLSFDLGYPNAYDRAHRRTGDYLMVHGSCVSIGCYAMGDAAIEEIYTLMEAAFAGGQTAVEVHALPFRFDRDDLEARLADARWGGFWRELRAGWDAFARDRVPPRIEVVDGRYVIAAAPL